MERPVLHKKFKAKHHTGKVSQMDITKKGDHMRATQGTSSEADSHQSQAIFLKASETSYTNSNGGLLGQNESDLVNFVSRNNRNIVSCRKLQDLEVQCIIKNCSQHLECESCCENSVDKITRKTQTQKPT